MANNGIISVVHTEKAQILQRLANGEPLTEIAHSLGLATHSAILERIGDDPDYQHALAASAWSKLQKRENQLEIADNNVTVTRADRLLGHARWFAERVARRWFGAETRLTGADGGPIQVQIVRFSGRVIEGDVVQEQHAAVLEPGSWKNTPVDPPSVKT